MPLIVTKILLMLGLQNSSFLLAKLLRLSRNNNSSSCNDLTERLFTSIFQTVSFFFNGSKGIDVTLVYGVDILPVYTSSMLVPYGWSKIASYSREMSEILYVPLVSPVHESTFPAEFNSILINRRSFRLYG